MGKHKAEKKPSAWSRRKPWQKGIILSVISVVLVLVIVLCIEAADIIGKISGIFSELGRDDDFGNLDNSQLGIDVELEDHVYNIALFGIDPRSTDASRGNSDSIMILSVNNETKQVKIVSIMRDSLVPIERESGTKYGKINAAYSYGGAELAVKTLNKVYNLNIQDYATVNFYGMADIIDAVGGIEVNVLQGEIDDTEYGINEMITRQCEALGLDPEEYIVTKAGRQHLNGIQAVAYARIRKTRTESGEANDFGRVERQQYVMQQLLQKTLELGSWQEYLDLADALAPNVTTSLTNSEMLSLLKVLSARPKLEQTRVPSDEYIINRDFREPGSSTVYYNYEYAADVIHAFLYDNTAPVDYMAENGIDKTEWYNKD